MGAIIKFLVNGTLEMSGQAPETWDSNNCQHSRGLLWRGQSEHFP